MDTPRAALAALRRIYPDWEIDECRQHGDWAAVHDTKGIIRAWHLEILGKRLREAEDNRMNGAIR